MGWYGDPEDRLEKVRNPNSKKKGLGLKKVFDLTNEIYGKDFYRYE